MRIWAQLRRRFQRNSPFNKWLTGLARIRAHRLVRMRIDRTWESYRIMKRSWLTNKTCRIKCEPSIILDQGNTKSLWVSTASRRQWRRCNICRVKDSKALGFKSSRIVVTFSRSNRGLTIEIREKGAINQVLVHMSKMANGIQSRVP